MRDKLIIHPGILTGSIRYFPKSGVIFRKTNENFGFLSKEDETKIQKLIDMYGTEENEILSIPKHPAQMFDKFIRSICKHNIELKEDDQRILVSIVQRNGGAIDSDILSKHIRQFLEDGAALCKKQVISDVL